MDFSEYRGILALTIFFILADVASNVVSMVVSMQNVHELLIYVMQDILLVFTIIVIFLLFSNTYVFQAGFVGFLVARFKMVIIFNIMYLTLSITLHVLLLKRRWDNIYAYVWTGGMTLLFVTHRITSVAHYYFFKRAVLRFSDDRFYANSQWLQEQTKMHR